MSVFPFWLEQFFPDLCLALQGLIRKNEKLIALSSTDPFWRLHSPPASIILRPQHTKLNCNTGQPCQGISIRHATYDEFLLFDDEASGAFRHVKLHPQIAASHAYSVGQTLHMSIGSVFGTNVIPHNWEVLAHSCCTLAVLVGPTHDSTQ